MTRIGRLYIVYNLIRVSALNDLIFPVVESGRPRHISPVVGPALLRDRHKSRFDPRTRNRPLFLSPPPPFVFVLSLSVDSHTGYTVYIINFLVIFLVFRPYCTALQCSRQNGNTVNIKPAFMILCL